MLRQYLYRFVKKASPIMAICIAMITFSCEEEDTRIAYDPTVKMFFLNTESLTKVTFVVDSLNEELIGLDTVIFNLKSEADVLADSIIVLTDSINDGRDDYIPIRDEIIDELSLVNDEVDIKETEDSTVNAQRNEWSGVASTINSGAVFISSIENSGRFVYYEDSATIWRLPLDMNADTVNLMLTIEGEPEPYGLKVAYQRSVGTDEKNRIVVETSNFKVVNSDFIKAEASCNDCLDYETTINIEF